MELADYEAAIYLIDLFFPSKVIIHITFSLISFAHIITLNFEKLHLLMEIISDFAAESF